MAGEQVLVTGGSGFVGAHCVVQLLQAGYSVRTTVRAAARAESVRAQVVRGGASPDALTFAEADLLSEAGWSEAVAGCRYVLHVASPFPMAQPRNEDELIIPARDGALRVLRAARDASVARVVLTSSFAAVGYGHTGGRRAFTEEDWTAVDGPGVTPYVKSKAVAERAAWDFVAAEGGGLELAVVNPVGILGPPLGPELSTSVQLLQEMLQGKVPALPNVSISVVDVRDVADLHIRAMTDAAAAGQRFLALADRPVTFPQIAALLHERLGEAARRVPTRVLPDWLVRVAAPVVPRLRQYASELGSPRVLSNAKARELLGWSPRSAEEAILASAEALLT
jgi:nucleoside-diphosphate-sugar epimerase